MQKEDYGEHDGKAVHKYTLSNESGMSVSLSTFGAMVVSCLAPDKDGKQSHTCSGELMLPIGKSEEVCLHYKNLEEIKASMDAGDWPYYGATCGQYSAVALCHTLHRRIRPLIIFRTCCESDCRR